MLRHSHNWTVAAVAFCAVCFGSAAIISKQDWAATERSQLNMARTAARLMEAHVTVALTSAMRALDQAQAIAEHDRAAGAAATTGPDQRFKDLVFANGALSTLYVVGVDGLPLMSGLDYTAGPSPRNGPGLLARHREQGPGVLIGPLARGYFSGIRRLTVSRGWLGANGEFLGIVVAGVRLDYFSKDDGFADHAPDIHVTLRTQTGETLARFPEQGTSQARRVKVAQTRTVAGLITVLVENDITDEVHAWQLRAMINSAIAFVLCAGFLMLWRRAVLVAMAEQRARDALYIANQNLEARVAHRTEHHRQLIKELTHRTKNILAVVQSVARHTANQSTTFATFEQSFAGRLAAIAASHDSLVKNHWEGAMLKDVVEAQLRPFVGRASTQLAIDGDPVMLKPKATEVLSLALHELATNAAKYGALSSPRGLVEVRWHVAANDGRQLVLEWRESGGPPVVPPTRKGFGQMVCQAMVERSIGGRATLMHEPDGVVWAFATDARRALAA